MLMENIVGGMEKLWKAVTEKDESKMTLLGRVKVEVGKLEMDVGASANKIQKFVDERFKRA